MPTVTVNVSYDLLLWAGIQALENTDALRGEQLLKNYYKDSPTPSKRRSTSTRLSTKIRSWIHRSSHLPRLISASSSHTDVSNLSSINLADARVLINKVILERIKRTEEQGRWWTLGPQLNDYEKVAEKVKQRQLTDPPVRPEDVEPYGLRIDSDRVLRHASDRPLGRVIETVENTPGAPNNPPSSNRQTLLGIQPATRGWI